MANTHLPYKFLGRLVKPLSFAAMLTMITIVVINILDSGIAGDALWGDFLSVVAGTSAIALAAGWWYQSQRMGEVGLLLAASVWFARGVFVLITLGPSAYNWAFNLCWTVALGGAYLLERAGEPRIGEAAWTRRSQQP